ncbi:hypothetical protein [Methyloversatilis sp. XJ19-49]|uniref:hypothetical protein n=1 Tax=Methyloversatilis sp. XJ19-49 TaxID=2963429 RepID=UPI00211CB01A|nr:hypothetical protein [Methyloversatilis sp. XJ19-49]MCQ9378848.1 hypothetical protein [Methyloversatilis sp. XJ19-49]
MTATAFSDHVRWASARHAVPRTRASARPQKLLAMVRDLRKVTTAELCEAAGLTSSIVWGALSYHIRVGRVRFHDGMWEWISGVVTDDEKRAAQFLRSRGWSVQEPNEDDDDGI